MGLLSNGVRGLRALSSNVHKLEEWGYQTRSALRHPCSMCMEWDKKIVRQILLNVGLENIISSEVLELELAKIRGELDGYMIERELVCC
jgi:hypothetical protein